MPWAPCIECGKEALVCETSTRNGGVWCFDCQLNAGPCEPSRLAPVFGYEPGPLHTPSCPKSPDFDGRKTRTNKARCNLEEVARDE